MKNFTLISSILALGLGMLLSSAALAAPDMVMTVTPVQAGLPSVVVYHPQTEKFGLNISPFHLPAVLS